MVQGVSSGMQGDVFNFDKHTSGKLERERALMIEQIRAIDFKLKNRPLLFDDGTPMAYQENKEAREALIEAKLKIEKRLGEIRKEIERERKISVQNMDKDALLQSIERDVDAIRDILYRVADKCQFFQGQ